MAYVLKVGDSMDDKYMPLVIGLVAILILIVLGFVCIIIIERMRIRAAKEISEDSLKQIFKDSGIKLRKLEK